MKIDRPPLISNTRISFLFLIACGVVAHGEFKPDPNTLFLLHFNEGLNADCAKGNAETQTTASLTEPNGGYAGAGLLVQGGLAVTPEGNQVVYRPLVYKAVDNFNSRRGTLETWVKILSLPKDLAKDHELGLVAVTDWRTCSGAEWALEGCTAYAYLAIIYGGKTKRITFTEFRREVKHDLAGLGTLNDDRFHLDAAIDGWKPGEWHHLAVTWDAEADKRSLFVDGKKAGETNSKFPDKLLVPKPTDLVVGGVFKRSAIPFPCVLDEVRVSDAVRYTADFDPKKQGCP